ncbi:hypothetical protein NHH03_11925 [Stieleria sp. TO1_6]|uniref:hypothetical protein n=1 Tax=Stieleria tagensis TaxID=2956795 RepID=UPI00209B6D22|nr:hypothetical protein [Stieleria tagensis]MCO8122446.1 hypothetical protein [Stieleria tagensis]
MFDKRSRRRRRLRTLLWKPFLASVSAGILLAFAGQARADGEMQLLAPLNSTLTLRAAEPVATPAELPPAALEPAASASEPAGANSKANKPSIQAIPASGPLDRFRAPAAKLPAMNLASPLGRPATAGTETAKAQIPTPGEQVLDRLDQAAEELPPLPGDSAWSSRGASQRTNSQAAKTSSTPALPPASTHVTDGFAPPAFEGGWVARDAINRIEPLRDPVSDARANVDSFQSQRQSQPPVNDSPAVQTQPAAVAPSPAKVAEKSVQLSAPETPASAAPKSMSLNEAKTAGPIKKSVDVDGKQDWADQMLQSLMEPQSTRSSNLNQAELGRADESTPEITPSAPATVKRKVATIIKPVEQVRPQATVSKQSTPEPQQSASVGDLAPDDSVTADSVTARTPVEAAPQEQLLDYTGNPLASIQPTRSVLSMRPGIERALSYFYERPEIATGRSNWGMMHSLMVFGADTKIIVGRQKFSAIAWIAGNNNCRGQRLLTHDGHRLQAKSGVGLQGHQGQFLAVLGMCNVPTSYPLHAGELKFSVADLIEVEKRDCKAGEELTFTLIGLSHYLDTDSTWIAADGTQWDFERLLAEELKQPIVGAACGGTHRLMGYAHALRKRRAEGKPITGQWKRAETYSEDFIQYAYSLQNRDGSMSTKWFEGRGDNGDVDRKIQTTGHIVEWLLTITPDDELQNRRLVAAVNFLYRSIGSNPSHDWSIGPKGHALRSLAMYHQRVFRDGSPWIPTAMASRQTQNRR